MELSCLDTAITYMIWPLTAAFPPVTVSKETNMGFWHRVPKTAERAATVYKQSESLHLYSAIDRVLVALDTRILLSTRQAAWTAQCSPSGMGGNKNILIFSVFQILERCVFHRY